MPTACVCGSSPARTPPAPVRAGIVNVDGDAPLIIARERGYFADVGITIDLVPFDNLARMVPLLSTGQLEVGGGPAGASLFNAVARGINLKIVADRGSLTPGHGYAAFVVRKDLADAGMVRDFADLRGKKVATSGKGTSSHLVIQQTLQAAGLKDSDWELIELPPGDMVSAMARRAIDAAFLPEPFVTIMQQQGSAVRFKGGDVIAPGEHIAVLLYAGDWATKNADVARDFMVAYLRGLRDYNAAFDKGVGKDAVLDIMTKYTSITDRKLYESMVKSGFDPDGRLDPAKLARQQDWFVLNGFQTQKVDIAKVVDLQYVDHAARVLGPAR